MFIGKETQTTIGHYKSATELWLSNSEHAQRHCLGAVVYKPAFEIHLVFSEHELASGDLKLLDLDQMMTTIVM